MNKKGFTLVELLAIIVILGILASISTAMVGNYVKESKKDATRVTAQNMINAVLGDLEINDELTEKEYDFLVDDADLLEKKLTTSAWDNEIVEARAIYKNDIIKVCIRDTKGNGIIGTDSQVKEQSGLKYEGIDEEKCAKFLN
jgi:prepilin-type N-terminal cleavage/methylation domain-containing protein